jgi:hypothetical protein
MKLHNQEMECFGYWAVPCSWNCFLCLRWFLFCFVFWGFFVNQLLKISKMTGIYSCVVNVRCLLFSLVLF